MVRIGMTLVWVAADWPVHDIGEQYLYLVHMIQHLVLTLVAPLRSCSRCPSGWPASCSEAEPSTGGCTAWPAPSRPR